ncbi:MAG TPA: APC family permease [Ilumatobacter sp.]|nr:APC family permease [Ilumatobacter sp.]
MAAGATLQRRLGTTDAVVIGAGSMIGAGVFAAWAPAARAAGDGLLIGLVIAAIVAICNALSSAQLAALYPTSGGTYVYGRARLGPVWGFIAGWGFVVGKIASCAAMSLTIGAYLWPTHDRWVAVAAVVAITLVNLGGLSRTVLVTKCLLAVSMLALVAVVTSGWSSDTASLSRLSLGSAGVYDVLQSAGFLFFAFAGYARIATLGEEVRDPERTIPLAIPLALGLVLVIYAIVAITSLSVVPAAQLAGSTAPLRLVAEAGSLSAASVVVRVGAGVAALGVLLNLIPGVSRTILAMGRNRELPAALAHVDARRSLPVRAELLVAAAVIALVIVVDLRSAIGISGVAVLTYYAIANASALTLSNSERRFHPVVAVVGLIGCLVLVAALPPEVIATGVATLLAGLAARLLTRRHRQPTT